mgnify:CR=1 FL=1
MNGQRARGVAGLTVGLVLSLSCNSGLEELLPARARVAPSDADLELVARLVHISDTHIVDEESPARLPGAHMLTGSAWRPQESYSAQLLDGLVRAVNRLHAAGRHIDFLVHTGDGCDNAQTNELAWLLTVFDGGLLDPRSGPDDRPADQRPPPELDPHEPFTAQGLYRQGVHGPAPSIPWYFVIGNHDVHALGVFPVFTDQDGRRTAPLPLSWRPGLVLPTYLDPLADYAYSHVTPAAPGPPCLLETPQPIVSNPQRAYVSREELISALWGTVSQPPGHGFDSPRGPSWYSAAPAPGLRLVVLDTTMAATRWPGGLYMEGAVNAEQVAFLRRELERAQAAGELVIVATHHPSESLSPALGTALTTRQWRDLLRSCPNVILHLAGHRHRNLVTDRGGYIEMETCSTLDPPHAARLVELWRSVLDDTVHITYEVFSEPDENWPELGPDPLHLLRSAARDLAAPQ